MANKIASIAVVTFEETVITAKKRVTAQVIKTGNNQICLD